MKRKSMTLVLAGILGVSLLAAGCGSSSSTTTDNTGDTGATSAAATEAASTSAADKTDASASSSTVAAASGDTTTAASADLSGTVGTDGSTSMEKVISYLSEAFMEEYPKVEVTYNPTGSSSGIQAVTEGSTDLGLASRDLKDDEKNGLTQTTIAIDGIAIIVNPNNKVKDISLDQIKQIYTGQITNWKDVGGDDGEIVCIGREAGSGTRDGFESITDTKDQCKLSQELTSTGDVIQTVANNPNAIGYASMADLNDTVQKLTVDGVECTEDTILDGSYKIQRNFNVITNDSKKLSTQAQAFYDYITSDAAADLIEKAGAVPVAKKNK
ncbi:MAG: phosphate ABC transporter substrate-binding protein [Bilifractor sp.]